MTTEVRERPKIRSLCIRCRVRWWDVEQRMVIVSPRGVAHFPRPWGETECGVEATSSRWWWPI